ncbi:MAG: hypothetical protein HYV07_30260 [Deltaproteobacteria bacterium]|nr:hypothetical protein [Deltaproteobacteria bacterium]
MRSRKHPDTLATVTILWLASSCGVERPDEPMGTEVTHGEEVELDAESHPLGSRLTEHAEVDQTLEPTHPGQLFRTSLGCVVGRPCDVRELVLATDGTYHLRVHHQESFLDWRYPIEERCEDGVVRSTSGFLVLLGCDGRARMAGPVRTDSGGFWFADRDWRRASLHVLPCRTDFCE